ncbi:MAG: hypothetical protein WAN03_21480 [Candidatus Sulfotelmatobacter sp.]
MCLHPVKAYTFSFTQKCLRVKLCASSFAYQKSEHRGKIINTRRLGFEIVLVVGVALAVGVAIFANWEGHKLRVLQGAIVMKDADARKEVPVPDAEVKAYFGQTTLSGKSNSSGLFVLKVPPGTRRGQPILFEFRQKDYRPLDHDDYVGDQLYVVHMVPLSAAPQADEHHPVTKIGNVTVRYSVKTMAQANIGSTVRTFQVENKGNVPCRNQSPCSPDGRWKAALGSTELDAGVGNEFRDIRVSCIAGPCPFTRVEPQRFTKNGQILTVAARVWSDTTTFLVEAEVLHPMQTEYAHEFYPVIFGKGLSFTLPPLVEGVTIEADVDSQDVFFPLGPALFLSWANCSMNMNPDQTRLYRCELKPGYRFQ